MMELYNQDYNHLHDISSPCDNNYTTVYVRTTISVGLIMFRRSIKPKPEIWTQDIRTKHLGYSNRGPVRPKISVYIYII